MNTEEIKEIVDELTSLFEKHKNDEPDTINEYMLDMRPEIKLFNDLQGCCEYCYMALKDVVKRYRVAPCSECDFIKDDVKRLCVLLFKPYFRVNWWLKEACSTYSKNSSDYKYEHGIVDLDPPDDIYNSVIVYLKDFVINMAA